MSMHDDLINGYLDGMLTDEQFAELTDWLQADSEHAKQFMKAAFMHSRIRDIMQQEDILGFLLADISEDMQGTIDPSNVLRLIEEDEEIKKQKAQAAADEQARLAAEAAERRQRMQDLASRKAKKSQIIEIPRIVGYLVVGSAASLLIFLAYSLLPPEEDGSAFREHIVRIEKPQTDVESKPYAVEISSASRDVLWATKGDPTAIGAPMKFGRHVLSQGVIELKFESNARIVIESPANLELMAADRVRVHSGKVVANVPEQALGFTIFAGSAAIVDLGTEFGVEANGDGTTSIHVLDGEVALVAKPRKPGVEPGASHTLLAGSARNVNADGDQISEIEFDQSAFIRQVPESPYELAVLRSRPLAFWRLNEPVGSTLARNFGRLSSPATIGAGIRLNSHGDPREQDNYAISLNGNHDGINSQEIEPFAFTNDFTIETWVRPDNYVNTMHRIVSSFYHGGNTLTGEKRSGFAFGIVHRSFHENMNPDDLPMRLLFTFYGKSECLSMVSLQPNEWAHVVAAIAQDGQPRLYINGQQVEVQYWQEKGGRWTKEWDSQFAGKSSLSPLFIGCNPLNEREPYPPESWHGDIDEVVIFDRCLSSEEILSHYQSRISEK